MRMLPLCRLSRCCTFASGLNIWSEATSFTPLSYQAIFMQLFDWRGVFPRIPLLHSGESDVSSHNEERIIERATQGDSEAFGILYERYVSQIYNYIYYRVGNVHDAEDLTERVFMRAMKHIRNYHNRGLPFSAWLYRIAHNLVANWYRDTSRRKEIPIHDIIPVPAGEDHPESSVLATEEREALLKVIRDLPPERQQLLILKFVERLSNAEIGRIMGRTEGAIKSLYHRTLISLRDEIGNHDLFQDLE
ncbi:MAG: sigma-70 family RNA polymerase sigma factor [Anaerolineae bacterium]|nr:MAG: sigma-70 family RNA polymerase sigma factor [Anaerolineae bacterium]